MQEKVIGAVQTQREQREQCESSESSGARAGGVAHHMVPASKSKSTCQTVWLVRSNSHSRSSSPRSLGTLKQRGAGEGDEGAEGDAGHCRQAGGGCMSAAGSGRHPLLEEGDEEGENGPIKGWRTVHVCCVDCGALTSRHRPARA